MTLRPQSVVGIDQGTTATKAYRLRADDDFQQLCSIEHRQIYPQPGWVEHDPRELLTSVERCLESAVGEFGIARRVNVPIVAGIVDQQAALFGHGCHTAGRAKITFGTGAFALAVTGTQPVSAPDLGLLPTVAWRLGAQTIYAVDAGVYDAGSALDWARRLGLFSQFTEIEEFEAPSAIERGIVFVPALSGLACPHWDRIGAGLSSDVSVPPVAAPERTIVPDTAIADHLDARFADAVERARGWRTA